MFIYKQLCGKKFHTGAILFMKYVAYLKQISAKIYE